ncbi:MAG: sporulation protein [Intestinimonas sp.]|jgi:sporulation integral membrane protein YlbJ|nr:sporulation protein [Intestinimonas sp.]
MSKLLARPGVRNMLLSLALLCAAASLMCWPQESIAAAKDGITLCSNVIIPSLFPFFVLSALVVNLGLADYLGRGLEHVMGPLFRLPGACASAVALGFIGGYPVGARTALSLYEKGLCSRSEAERLLAFCNNSGPAFILGVVGAGVFASNRIGILLYLAHAAASLCIGLLFRFYHSGDRKRGTRRAHPSHIAAEHLTVVFTTAVKDSFLSILNICAFVIFFSVAIRMLFLSGILPGMATVLSLLLSPIGLSRESVEHLLTGAIELSSGVWSLTGPGALAGKLSMAAFMLGWAGVSIHCQVLSFLGGSGLSTRTYFVGKLLHGVLSAVFITGLVHFVGLGQPVSACLAEQVENIAELDFSTVLTLSLAVAFLVWLLFFAMAVAAAGKLDSKPRRHVL